MNNIKGDRGVDHRKITSDNRWDKENREVAKDTEQHTEPEFHGLTLNESNNVTISLNSSAIEREG